MKKNLQPFHRIQNNCQGAALVETALILGLFLFIVCGTVQLCVLAEKKQLTEIAVSYAALARARLPDSQGEAEILDLCQRVYFAPSDQITISYSPQNGTNAPASAALTCATPTLFPSYPKLESLFQETQGFISVTAAYTNAH